MNKSFIVLSILLGISTSTGDLGAFKSKNLNLERHSLNIQDSQHNALTNNNLLEYPNTANGYESTAISLNNQLLKKRPIVKNTVKSIAAIKPKSKIELLDWWKSARYVFSRGTVAEITDVYTGKSFKAKRTMGTNHADTEALTKKDAKTIKGIWKGFSWVRRPVIVKVNGRKLAASMSAMPHAGLDCKPAYSIVNNRSDGYGRGQNLDVIKGNGMNGHFDIHFLNSTRHKDNKKDPQHQMAIRIATR